MILYDKDIIFTGTFNTRIVISLEMPEQILSFMILLLHQQGGKPDSFEDVGEIPRPFL